MITGRTGWIDCTGTNEPVMANLELLLNIIACIEPLEKKRNPIKNR
jgi:hypothetical protein